MCCFADGEKHYGRCDSRSRSIFKRSAYIWFKRNRCSHVFVNFGLELFKMPTVINILVTLNCASSTCEKILSNAMLSIDEIGTRNEIRFWPSFYLYWADSSIMNLFLLIAFVFFEHLSWGVVWIWFLFHEICGNILLVPRIRFSVLGHKMLPCSMKQHWTV